MPAKTSHILRVEDHHEELVLKRYNVTRQQSDKDIDSIIEWYKRQPHLPRVDLDRHFVEGFLIRKKYSMENSKTSLDLYFSYRHQAPEFYDNRVPKILMDRAKHVGIILPLPTLDSDAVRTSIFRLEKDIDVRKYELLDTFRLVLLLGQFRSTVDIVWGERHIYDCTNLTAALLLKLYPSVVKKGLFIIQKIFGSRLIGLHFILPNSFVEKLSMIIKPLLSAKLQQRIHFHSKIEDVHEFVPKETLPSEYGGNAGSYYDIIESWEELFSSDEFNEWFEKNDGLKSDESLRIGESADYCEGVPGSFRQLTID